MYRKGMRMAAFALLCVLLTGCTAQSAGEAKLLKEEVSIATGNVKSVTAEVGSLYREFTMNAEIAYVKKTVVRLEADEALYVEHLVTMGQTVKAGDVIAVFRKNTDDLRLMEIEMELEQIERERQDGLDDRAEQMEEMQESIDKMDGNLYGYVQTTKSVRTKLDQDVLKMQKQRMEVEQEQFLLRLDERVRKLKEERRKLKEAEEELTVTTPVDGVVGALNYLTAGVQYSRGQSVVTLYDPEKILLTAETGLLGEFRVGQTVEVQYGRRNERNYVTGRVIAADNLLDEDRQVGRAYIALDEWIAPGLLMSPQVRSIQMQIDNVLVLPRDAVLYEGGKAYVEILNNGAASMRYVLDGPNDGENIMILGGLEEGTAVVDR